MSISFGTCESSAGPVGVAYWDSVFKQAAAEGISSFVSSGDSGASGCDDDFTTPPTSPKPNSPNYICSSSYATCVGGTEFNDAANPSLYWNASDDSFLVSARGYIPEGGWNEPLSSTSTAQVAASGGGVSTVIPTPSWQTGAGMPAARSGRYTPDVAFSASVTTVTLLALRQAEAVAYRPRTEAITSWAFAVLRRQLQAWPARLLCSMKKRAGPWETSTRRLPDGGQRSVSVPRCYSGHQRRDQLQHQYPQHVQQQHPLGNGLEQQPAWICGYGWI
jgi:hypothetical protein